MLSRWLTSLLLSVIPALPVPISLSFATDWRVISFAAAVSAVAALLSGLVPALHASKSDLVPSLKAEGLDGGMSRLRLRSVLVVGQVTMSLMLVITAGLLLRSLQQAAHVDPGFDVRNVDVMSFDLSLAGYTQPTSRPFVADLLARTRNLPGVTAVTMGMDLPLDGGRMGMGGLRIRRRRASARSQFVPHRLERRRARLVRHAEVAARQGTRLHRQPTPRLRLASRS